MRKFSIHILNYTFFLIFAGFLFGVKEKFSQKCFQHFREIETDRDNDTRKLASKHMFRFSHPNRYLH